MKVVISPAFNMSEDHDPAKYADVITEPRFLEEARQIAQEMKTLAPWEIAQTCEVKEELALDAFERWQSFPTTDKEQSAHPGLPALLAFNGIQYNYIDSESFTNEDWKFAAENVRIISPCYGVLRATDEIHPYRLQLPHVLPQSDMTVEKFWGDKIVQSLQEEDDEFILLSSKEYTSLLMPVLKRTATLSIPDFKIPVKGRLRTQSTWAKMARGTMTSFIIKNRILNFEEIKGFLWKGFSFDEGLSLAKMEQQIKKHESRKQEIEAQNLIDYPIFVRSWERES